jgi:hypothetical protein
MVGGTCQPHKHPLNPIPQLTTVSNPNKFSRTVHALLFKPLTLALKTHTATTASGMTASGMVASGIAASGRAASASAASGRAASGRTASGTAVSGRTASGRAVSGMASSLRYDEYDGAW